MRNGIKAGLAAFACAAPLALPAEAMTIFVSNEKGNSISVVNGETLEVTDTVEVGNRPRGIALSPNHRFLYICASDDDHIEVMDTASLEKIGRASCRERVCQYVSISVVAVSLKKKISNNMTADNITATRT